MKYSELLCKKVYEEQEKYHDWLVKQPPEKILEHCYSYSVRNDIVLAIESGEFSEKLCRSLCTSSSPLSDIEKVFDKYESSHMDEIRGAIEDTAKRLDAASIQKATVPEP